MKIITFLFSVLLLANTINAEILPINNFTPHQKPTIEVQNKVLLTVNGTAISVVDVMKKMNMVFYRSYPDLASSEEARYQFYTTAWKSVLAEMLNTELMLADAKQKEMKLSDGEIREEMEERFGPNIMSNLDKLDLSYQEAWDMLKKEMIVTRMTWFFIHNKALQAVTPQDLKQAYRLYCENNPTVEKWVYNLISIRSQDKTLEDVIAQEAYDTLSKLPLLSDEAVSASLKEIEKKYDTTKINMSKNSEVTSKEVSASHKSALSSISVNSFSTPISQISRIDNKKVYRIFLLKDYEKKDSSLFNEVSEKLKNELLQREVVSQSDKYFSKLRKRYDINDKILEDVVKDNYEPFVLR
jgi:hypothetical protein